MERRGSLTVWISNEAVKNWLVAEKSGARGVPRQYSDVAISTAAVLKAVFHLAGRQVVGLIKSLFELMQIELPVPDHSTLSRRMETLDVALPLQIGAGEPRHLVIDSTGVKVYGEREWKVRTHGAS